MIIENVEVMADKDFSEAELKYYVELAKSKSPKMTLKTLEVKLAEDGGVDLKYYCEGIKFERIRRITDYQTGDLTS